MRHYDLWIDESGGFDSDTQNIKPSLIGGALIPAGALSDQKIRMLAYPHDGAGHATELNKVEAAQVVLPALEAIRDCGGHLVYFENRERISHWGNRELYLRLLAMGLAQLVRYLSSRGAFQLNITVALRLVPENGGLVEISPEEYRQTLKQYISSEFDALRFALKPGDRVALTILSARKEARLVLADYACNARYSINAKKYASVRTQLKALFEKEYIFTVNAQPLESAIRARLAEGDISGALAAYYSVRKGLREARLFNEILDVLCGLSYRLQRHHLRAFAAEIRAFAARETDFERSEALLAEVCREVFGTLQARNVKVQIDEDLFGLQLALADMYLREGDVLNASPVMNTLACIVSDMNYRAEHIAQLYLYREKLALLQINSMDYEAAVHTMQQTINTMELLISIAGSDELLSRFFNGEATIRSEYLGDAYCMMIYAELFLQRRDIRHYETIKGHIKTALQQYRYPGELERNLQYLSKAENEQGHCQDALKALLKTQEIACESDPTNACIEYLRAAALEDTLSQTYYTMYYVEILEKAAELEDFALCDAMQRALEQEQSIVTHIIKPSERANILSDAKQEHETFVDVFSDGKLPRRYHPLEIVLWKYGCYQWLRGSKSAATEYWSEAIAVCDENPSYTVLKLVSIAILLEWQSRACANGRLNPTDKTYRSLCTRIELLFKNNLLPDPMREYVDEVRAFIKNDALNAETAFALSQRIAF